MPTINILPVSLAPDYEKLLSRFPEEYREKLRLYTGEELFYIYKLATYKPKKIKVDGVDMGFTGSDMLFLSLKAKLFRWLKGQEKWGVNPAVWQKLGRKFRYSFEEYIDAPIQDSDVA